MQDFEKLGVFYLGRAMDPASGAPGELLLYDAKDLTTHAVIVGMTGSGKTGLADADKRLAELDQEVRDAAQALQSRCGLDSAAIESFRLAPRKSDILVESVVLAWEPA